MIPPWVEHLYRSHHRWVERAYLGLPLSEAEALQRERDYGLLRAYEWWDGGEGVAFLAAKLAIASEDSL